MDILNNITNNIQYNLSQLGKNPEAEKFAKERKEKLEEETRAKQTEAERLKAEADAKKKEVEDRERAEADTKKRQSLANFNVGRFLATSTGTAVTIIFCFLLVGCGILGASLATNLNLYREWSYRIFYLVYGFLFSPIVIVYVYLYRWWWKEKRPKFYALFPLIPYRLDHPWMARFFSWLSYKPDDYIHSLEEWRKEMSEKK